MSSDKRNHVALMNEFQAINQQNYVTNKLRKEFINLSLK